MVNKLRFSATVALAFLTVSGTSLIAGSANAAPIVVTLNQSFASTPITFSYGGSTFTLTGTGDIFAPTAISGTGQFQTIFGSPTSSFSNRGTVTFGPSMQYATFSTPTPIRFSNSDNFIGLAATIGASTFYGYAYTTDTLLRSFAFESTPGATITATTGVPEPAAWAMMVVGFGLLGTAMRRSPRTGVAFA